MTLSPYERVITHISKAALARAFKISGSAVSQWATKGIPANRVVEIEQLTKGQVTRHEMRPDVFPENE